MTTTFLTRGRAAVAAAGIAAAAMSVAAPAVAAEEVAIRHVAQADGGLQILISLPEGAEPDLGEVRVAIDGEDAPATATTARDDSGVRRTTVLAIDVSRSMRGARFAAAKDAAETFLATVPEDVFVGITTFAGEVANPLEPTLDRDAARAVLGQLELSRETRLYDGVIAAAELTGRDGQRDVIVLSDGADTSKTSLGDVVATVEDTEVLVDVVALDQGGPALRKLRRMAEAGSGEVISADPEALRAAFSREAEALARQIVVTAELPKGLTEREGTVEVSVPAGDTTLTAAAFVPLSEPAPEGPAGSETKLAPSSGFALPRWVMFAGVGALGLSLVVLLVNLIPAPANRELTPDERVAKYAAVTTGIQQPGEEGFDRDAAMAQARHAAEQMLVRSKSLEARIAGRLEAAGSELKAPEWLLIHTGIVLGSGVVGTILAGALGGLLFTAAGVVVPWLWLGFKRGRRLKAFNSSLPDTLQLMAGSLQAGLSLAQSVNTIVQEGTEPIAGEFKRVLVETRLGVALEDALEGVTERFESKDFAWVVMAIKIQRQVGGNLAELLNTVAGTIREREYMRRQVAALAAEGKLSAVVLGGLPPAFLTYLVLVNRDYVMPMFTDPMGWVMLGGGGLLLGLGIFWMSRLVKVEV